MVYLYVAPSNASILNPSHKFRYQRYSAAKTPESNHARLPFTLAADPVDAVAGELEVVVDPAPPDGEEVDAEEPPDATDPEFASEELPDAPDPPDADAPPEDPPAAPDAAVAVVDGEDPPADPPVDPPAAPDAEFAAGELAGAAPALVAGAAELEAPVART